LQWSAQRFVERSAACWRLSLTQGQRPQVLAVELQQVEGVKHGIRCAAASVERIEHGDTVWTGDHSLAIDRERLWRAASWRLTRWPDSGRSSHSRDA
jgi:hypothetical protein